MIQSLLLLTVLFSAQPAAAADDALRLEVQPLVQQLESPKRAEREAAENALLKLGAEKPAQVLDLLPPGGANTPELDRIKQKLQQVVAEAAARPALITLRGDGLPLSQVLAALEKQSGNRIIDDRGAGAADPPLKVNFDKTPFWQALDAVLDQAGLTVYLFGKPRAIHIVARSEGERPRVGRASYSGPFRVEPLTVAAHRDLRNPQGDNLRLTLEVAWEPRLRPIGLKQRFRDLKAVDEQGRPLPVANEAAELEAPSVGDNLAVELLVPFRLPDRGVREITSLRGTLQAMLPGKIETFSFDNVVTARNVEKRIAGVVVTLERVQPAGELWQVLVRLKFDRAGDAFESHRPWYLRNEAWLEGPGGKRVPFAVVETSDRTLNSVDLMYSFALGEPLRKHAFVTKTPGAIVSTGFTFELKGIRLP